MWMKAIIGKHMAFNNEINPYCIVVFPHDQYFMKNQKISRPDILMRTFKYVIFKMYRIQIRTMTTTHNY